MTNSSCFCCLEEAQKQLEVEWIDNTLLNLQEENEAMKANLVTSSGGGGTETTLG